MLRRAARRAPAAHGSDAPNLRPYRLDLQEYERDMEDEWPLCSRKVDEIRGDGIDRDANPPESGKVTWSRTELGAPARVAWGGEGGD